MRQCPYFVRFFTGLTDSAFKNMVEARCVRRSVLGSPGWHLHDAPLPEPLWGMGGIRIRWRSTNTADHHAHYAQSEVVR